MHGNSFSCRSDHYHAVSKLSSHNLLIIYVCFAWQGTSDDLCCACLFVFPVSATCHKSLSHRTVTAGFSLTLYGVQLGEREGEMLNNPPFLISSLHLQHRTHQIDFNQAIK